VTLAYTTGVFDILHKGHINVLNEAHKLADRLVVGVQDAEAILRTKGRYPTLSNLERVEQLKSLPFVDDVFIYSDTNQIPNLERLKPDVLVQGDDWLHTGDRTRTVEYLNKQGIRLVLIPYTQGVSSTELRKRLVDAEHLRRKDDSFLGQHIKLFKINELKTYEKHDEGKVVRLVKKIEEEGVFLNPITVANLMVIDGANRFEAIRRLGVSYVPAFVVDYSEDVELRGNVHYLRAALAEILPAGTKKVSIADAIEGLKTRSFCAFVDDSSDAYGVDYVEGLKERVKTLNSIVSSYLGRFPVARLSEFALDTGLRVVFGTFLESELLELAETDLRLQSGITWHRQKHAVLRFPVPLTLLRSGFDMQEFVKHRSEGGEIRYYPQNVYVCDEWSTV